MVLRRRSLATGDRLGGNHHPKTLAVECSPLAKPVAHRRFSNSQAIGDLGDRELFQQPHTHDVLHVIRQGAERFGNGSRLFPIGSKAAWCRRCNRLKHRIPVVLTIAAVQRLRALSAAAFFGAVVFGKVTNSMIDDREQPSSEGAQAAPFDLLPIAPRLQKGLLQDVLCRSPRLERGSQACVNDNEQRRWSDCLKSIQPVL